MTNIKSFNSYSLSHGILSNMEADIYPTQLWGCSHNLLQLHENATHFGYVYDGILTISHSSGVFELKKGMYFSAPGKSDLYGAGEGIVISRLDYKGFFNIGGPVEAKGRLKYIDGCTDSLIIPPVQMGDSCLNMLHFPPAVNQTRHTHPSIRVGIVLRGKGECITPIENTPLVPGCIFVIPTGVEHSFHSNDSEMSIIVYHPDSDFGPTHECHPMMNRTIVEGVSANKIKKIWTKE